MTKVALPLLLSLSLLSSAGKTQVQKTARIIVVHAHRFAFEPSIITVHRGETIELRLISDDVPHSLLIRELGINEAASKSHPGDAIFTVNRTGDFQGRCGRFCGSGHGHMHFTVHVTDN
ncbi:MAG TPA: cytochrome c oxidase subunit II [Acidobacteriaceae bacterium]|jgi:cytochrome c oxidase subunit 2|nr:cytochrome c oxidase subunit II [Acidobacteriaceae bacterium]